MSDASVQSVQDFAGLKALVTGGASGIGRATAELLAARGADVAVLDRDITDVEKPLRGYAADVTDDAAVRAAVAAAARDLGGLDVLVNNAGIGAQGTVADNDDAEWHRVLDVNVIGMVRVARAALPALRDSEHATIVNTCSIAATAGIPQRALYAASKGAVLSLTLAMAADHIREGIRVNCVNPGTADTPGSAGSSTRRTTRPPNAPPSKPASPPGAWSPPPKSRAPSPTWRARCPARRPARP